MPVLLTPSYFGSISFWTGIMQYEKLSFEVCENYQKQSLRNRCNILSANGVLSLTVPVNYSQKNRQLYRDVKIANGTNWQSLHFKSLNSAYLMSPFFEYYIDDFHLIFEKQWQFLLDLNLYTYELICKCLDLKKDFELSHEFIKTPIDQMDLRYLASKKANTPFQLKEYQQVFSEKHDFVQDLSILDLLFNEGPNTENLILKQFHS